ncbi:MAG: hypothetical protein ACKKMV_00345 [Candidatus Nealsonbacteria bacterium]
MTNTNKVILILVFIGFLIWLIPNLSESNQSSESIILPEQKCHPSYSGCLNPNASDYDCAGGSGNGPYYTGRVRVIGPDVFGLDRDGDGWGCE